jgi:hypothetical protein
VPPAPQRRTVVLSVGSAALCALLSVPSVDARTFNVEEARRRGEQARWDYLLISRRTSVMDRSVTDVHAMYSCVSKPRSCSPKPQLLTLVGVSVWACCQGGEG